MGATAIPQTWDMQDWWLSAQIPITVAHFMNNWNKRPSDDSFQKLEFQAKLIAVAMSSSEPYHAWWTWAQERLIARKLWGRRFSGNGPRQATTYTRDRGCGGQTRCNWILYSCPPTVLLPYLLWTYQCIGLATGSFVVINSHIEYHHIVFVLAELGLFSSVTWSDITIPCLVSNNELSPTDNTYCNTKGQMRLVGTLRVCPASASFARPDEGGGTGDRRRRGQWLPVDPPLDT
jgi:hypothetical protein